MAPSGGQKMSIIIRRAAAGDSAAILEIYTPYVLNTAITFEIAVPSAEDFSRRVASICGQYPYLVMENDGRVVAYA